MAKKNLNMDKIKIFDPALMRKVASMHVGLVRRRATEKGLDFRGKQFPPYSTDYAKLLAKDFRKKGGGRYKGFEGVSLVTSGSKQSKHLFVLTGITMSGLQVISVDKRSYTMGWRGEDAEVIIGNAKRGRNLKDGVPTGEKDQAVDRLEQGLAKEFKKIPNRTVIKV